MSTPNYASGTNADPGTQKNEVHHVQSSRTPGAAVIEHKGPTHHVIEQLHAHDGVAVRDLATKTFPFGPSSKIRGLARIGGALVLTAFSIFLFREIPATPALRVDIGIIGGIGLIAAAMLAYLSIRDLLGVLTIDSRGIVVRPGVLGFAIPWTSLNGWSVRIDQFGGPALTFKVHGGSPKQIPASLLTEGQLTEVWQILRSQAMSKESA